MSVFKKAARALFGRSRKAAAVATVTTLLVAASVVSAVADHYKINYESGSLKNWWSSDAAHVSLNADIDINGNSGVSSVSDWNQWSVDVTTTDGDSWNLSSDDWADDGAGVIVVENGAVTGWNVSFDDGADRSFSSFGILGNNVMTLMTDGVVLLSPFSSVSVPNNYTDSTSGIWEIQHCPELGTMGTFALGLLGLAWFGRKGFDQPSSPKGKDTHERVSAQAVRIRRRANRRDLTA